MNKFEVVLIFNPELATNALKNETDKFKLMLDTHSGKVINDDTIK